MNKIDLVLHPLEWTSFKSAYLESVFNRYFNYKSYDETTIYDKNSTIFVASSNSDFNWIHQARTNGYKVAVDCLWDGPLVNNNFFQIINPNWFWYNDSLLYKSISNNNYKPNKSYKKLAFMPMNKPKVERQMLVNQLSNRLNNFIYSFDSERLPDDKSVDAVNWVHYFNGDWYDSTYFSLVAETTVTGNSIIKITEKSCKPLAFYHPFLILGQVDTVNYIQRLGFETFENLFDQSYDKEIDLTTRIKKIVQCVDDFDVIPYDQLTIDKLKHNHNLFFNTDLVTNRIIDEIINPIIEFANAE